MSEPVEFEYRANMARLFGELRGLDTENKRAAEQVGSVWSRVWRRVETAGTGALSKMSDEAGKVARAGSLVGGELGGAIGDVADLAELAHGGLSGMGLALGAVGVGVGSVVALGGAVLDVVANVDELDLSWTHHAEALRTAGDAYDGLQTQVEHLQITLAARAAPALTNVFDTVSGGVQVVIGASEATSQFDWAMEGLTGAIGAVLPGLDQAISMLGIMRDVGAEAREETDAQTEAIRRFSAALDEENRRAAAQAETEAALMARTQAALDQIQSDWEAYEREQKRIAAEEQRRAEQAQRQAEARMRAAEQARDFARDVRLSEADDEARLLAQRDDALQRYTDLARQAGLNQAEIARSTTEIIETYEAKLDRAREARAAREQERVNAVLGAQRAIGAAFDGLGDGLDASGLQDAATAAFAALGTALENEEDGLISRMDSTWSTIAEITGKGAGMISSLIGSIGGAHVEVEAHMTDTARRELQRRLDAQKIAAATQAGLSTAAGAIAAFASAPGPVGVGLAAATVAFGAAQIAIISGTDTQLHVGGMVGAGDPDEVNATLLNGEAVLSRTGVESAGGPEGVDQLNRGRAPSSAPTMALVTLDGRVIDALWTGSSRNRRGLERRVRDVVAGGIAGRTPRGW